MVKWWDRFWGAVWMIGSVATAYLTARWFAINASPADLGGLRYGLIAFSGLFGLLIGAFILSIATIGIMGGVEALLARAGRPVRRPPPADKEAGVAGRGPVEGAPAAPLSSSEGA